MAGKRYEPKAQRSEASAPRRRWVWPIGLSLAGVVLVLSVTGFTSVSRIDRSRIVASESGGGTVAAVRPGDYTTSQMKALGLETPPLPDELGLPACHPDPNWKGFANPEEAATAVAATPSEPTCAASPRDATFSVGMPAPHASYHHNAHQTRGKFQGSNLAAEVGNPDVDHGGATEFVTARPLAKTDAGNWIEDGWAEVSWHSDVREVYYYTVPGNTWIFQSGYPLSTGSYYWFRVEDDGANDARAEIYWNGSWNVIGTNTSMHCRNSDGSNNCYIENYLEIYSSDRTPHPDMNAPVDGAGVNFQDGKLRTAPGTWSLWTTTYTASEGQIAPYVVCYNNKYSNWRAGKSLTC